jgi:hypothetical protein
MHSSKRDEMKRTVKQYTSSASSFDTDVDIKNDCAHMHYTAVLTAREPLLSATGQLTL